MTIKNTATLRNLQNVPTCVEEKGPDHRLTLRFSDIKHEGPGVISAENLRLDFSHLLQLKLICRLRKVTEVSHTWW